MEKNQNCIFNYLFNYLIDFSTKYDIIGGKLNITSIPTIIYTVPNFSSNPEGNNYDKYCKYQLLNYKPWDADPNPAWIMIMFQIFCSLQNGNNFFNQI